MVNASSCSQQMLCIGRFCLQHIMIDLGTGNNNKINWALNDKQEFIDIVETVYRGARKGRGLVVAPKGDCWNIIQYRVLCLVVLRLCFARGKECACRHGVRFYTIDSCERLV